MNDFRDNDLPGQETRLRHNRRIFRNTDKDVKQLKSRPHAKRPNLTQAEVLILKQAWAQDQPQGAVHSL